GRYYSGSGAFGQLQEWYPDPPLVILLSNNEARRVKTKHNIEARSKRYVDKYGTGTPLTAQCRAMAEGYIERYGALLKGMHDGLKAEAWRRNRLFVAYGAFGPSHFGRWGDWPRYSFATEDRMDPWHLVWDGGSPSYYTHDWDASTDYRVWSPQVQAMNWVFMLEEAYEESPDFWFEISIWDGNRGSKPSSDGRKEKRAHYLEAGQEWSADRYGGFVQYGMWLTRPRAMREFRGSTVKRADFTEEFAALLAAVDRVYEDPVLTKFWRRGELVPNRSRQHPYQTKIPEKWQGVDRWFMLNTSLDPPGAWDTTTEIPVFSLARMIGELGGREWLLYAHAPVAACQDVEIEIPEYGKVLVDVTPGGSFYHIIEKAKSVTPIR
ncbi:MAG: proline racemase family protein, partial [Candidatus Brocadiaceae bacterium]